jgi:hypothetical protein
LSTGFMLALTLWNAATREFDIHWNVVAYLAFLPAAALFVRSRWLLVAHLGFGGVVGIVQVIVTLLTPLPETTLGIQLRDVNRNGMQLVAAEIAEQMDRSGVDFVAAPDWATASRIAFAMGPDRLVTSISTESDQFDLWYPGATLAGQDAIVVLRGQRPDQTPELPFDQVERLGETAAERFGTVLGRYTLYLGRNYRPAPSSFDAGPALP